ncbi:MAG: hypothetical protein C4326_14610 [Ignavibacteria bacterium]
MVGDCFSHLQTRSKPLRIAMLGATLAAFCAVQDPMLDRHRENDGSHVLAPQHDGVVAIVVQPAKSLISFAVAVLDGASEHRGGALGRTRFHCAHPSFPLEKFLASFLVYTLTTSSPL